MPGSQFQAEPAAIAALGQQFADAASEIAAALAGFEGTAKDVGEAFGLLGPSEEMFRAYQRSVDEAVDGMQGASGLLGTGGQQLSATAASYAGAEEASTPAP